MSRQLDLQIYLALHGYPLKEIPEERFDDYMREPHYSTDAEAMLELDREMKERGWACELKTGPSVLKENWGEWHILSRYRNEKGERHYAFAPTEPLARALAAHKALTGKEWEGEGE